MSEFKITYETTLYELQEYCKKWEDCEGCELDTAYGRICSFGIKPPPCDWNIAKPKTYKEDFLEKFPNAKLNSGIPEVCRNAMYGISECEEDCTKCWNELMEE